LRLVPDDVPIRGRVLDTQGRPISGVAVKVAAIEDPPAGNLDALLETGTIRRSILRRLLHRRVVYQGGIQDDQDRARWSVPDRRRGPRSAHRARVRRARDRTRPAEDDDPLCPALRPAAAGADRPLLSPTALSAPWHDLRLCRRSVQADRRCGPGQRNRPAAGRGLGLRPCPGDRGA
jgi:hypothetical protein